MTPAPQLPNALQSLGDIDARLAGRDVAVFLDYDGTLTPIVSRPDLAELSEGTRTAIRHLAERHMVAIVSGRDRAEVRGMVGLDGLIYAGSHGFDIEGPDGLAHEHEEGARARASLDGAAAALESALRSIQGAWVERKRFAVAVHFRQVAPEDESLVRQAMERVAEKHADLRKTGGKKVLELRPDVEWHKGKAIAWLLHELGLDHPGAVSIYIGDDETDEDAFKEIGATGIGVLVASEPRPTHAAYLLRDADEVRRFLAHLAER